MSGNFEKSVKGATKVKVSTRGRRLLGLLNLWHSTDSPSPKQLAAPKSKYIEHILVATHTGEAGVAEIFRTVQLRLRDSTWTIVFKSLIVIHIMIREGQLDATLQYMAENPRKLAISGFSEGMRDNEEL